MHNTYCQSRRSGAFLLGFRCKISRMQALLGVNLFHYIQIHTTYCQSRGSGAFLLLSRLTNLSHCVSVIGRCVCGCVSCVYADVRNCARSVRERDGGREGGEEGGGKGAERN